MQTSGYPQTCHPLHHEFCRVPSHGSHESIPQMAHHPGIVVMNVITPRGILLPPSGDPKAARGSPGKEKGPLELGMPKLI